ncbi:MAG: lysophospholipid acyltransferase family protein [Oceanipulchritudo sp.]
MARSDTELLDFRDFAARPWQRTPLRLLQKLLDPLLHTASLNGNYRQLLEKRAGEEGSFFDQGLAVLGIKYRVTEEDLERIPAEGPVFVVANHPYGGVDGLVMGSILDRVRPDGKLLVNFLLDRIDHMGGRCFFVDPFGGVEAARANLRGLKASLRWLHEGHALATFPSGTVSHLRPASRSVTDPAWAENLAPVIRRTGATVVPMYFAGRNSNFFQLAGLLHPRMRTVLLAREMLRSRNRVMEVRIGNPIRAKRLEHFPSNNEVMEFLRLRTYILKSREVAEKTTFTLDLRRAHSGKEIVGAQPAAALAAELEDLPGEALLLEHPPFAVYAARAASIPRILMELGRLREITFRAVGEGTGEATDLDRFDPHYWHLFIWNREESEIVGAYRLGLTDEILPAMGKKGLYTSTLFRFKPGILQSIDPGIELGRSFVVEKYQRKPLSLGLLWKGIGRFISLRPRYCTLFGPVSISNEYRSLSKNLMVAYLRENNLDPVLASKVKARNPARTRSFGSLDRNSFRRSVRDIEDVSALISEIEREERGVPVLLRQYLKLNATLLSFNVDPAFNDSLDGLMLVDLRRTAVKVLEKYMGPEGARAFLAHHRQQLRGNPVVNPFLRGGESVTGKRPPE